MKINIFFIRSYIFSDASDFPVLNRTVVITYISHGFPGLHTLRLYLAWLIHLAVIIKCENATRVVFRDLR